MRVGSCWRLSLMILVIGAMLSVKSTKASNPSNVVVMVSDDQRFDTIHALGQPYIATPNLDRLVREGTTMTRAYCLGSNSGAVCLPSRAMLLSGRPYFNTPNNLEGFTTFPEAFGAAGYQTFGTGKWHNGGPSFARSFQGGSAIFFGGMSDHDQVPIQPFAGDGRYHRDRVRSTDTFSSVLFTDQAVAFLESRDRNTPFLLYVSYTAPHDPRTPPPPFDTFYDPSGIPLPGNYVPRHPFDNGDMTLRDEKLLPWPRTPEAIRRELALYYGMITHMDAQIGRIFEALETTDAWDETIIVFLSDHGLSIGSHGLLGKQNMYDHSMRSPVIFRGPGIPADRRIDSLCYLMDIAPTLFDLTGVEPPETVSAQSMAGVVRGDSETQASGRDAIMTAYKDVQRAAFDGRWKLIRYPQINKTQLFDLRDDPLELRDLAHRRPRIVERMTAWLMTLQDEMRDTLSLTSDQPQPASIDLPITESSPTEREIQD